jgi:M6 family metalloprotease-like protein
MVDLAGTRSSQRETERNMKFSITRLFLIILFLFLPLTSDLYGVSLSPELIERLRKEGRLEEVVRQANLAREKGVWQPNPNPPLRATKGDFAGADTLKPIVICVDFDDKERTYSAGKFDTLLFSKNFVHPTGSMRDFYLENSYGKLDLVGGVTGWYKMSHLHSYYVTDDYGFGPPPNARTLARHAVNAADPYVDFGEYDYDGDGWVDALIIVHAGPGAEETADSNHIWSHEWALDSILTRDGVKLHEYNMNPETYQGGLVNMGVFSHEFGHTLGLPDLYDTDYETEGLGDWSIMAHGSWNHQGASPAHFDGWCKYKLGFTDVDTVTDNRTDVKVLQAETSPVSYRLWASDTDTLEYFLVENRQKTGFDFYLPGHGLLIYHVDEARWGNDLQWCPDSTPVEHYEVALEQADGWYQLEGCYGSSNQGNAGDPFPGSRDKRAFDDTTTPSTRDYYDNSTQVAVWNISDSDSAMTANLDVTWSRPCLFLDQFVLDDTTYGNGNGLLEPGEKIKLYFTISNIWLPLSGTTVIGSADEAGISFSDSQSNLGDIPTGGSKNSYSDPMEFDISPSFTNAVVAFTLHVEGNGGSYSLDFQREEWIGRPDILIVDDDSGTGKYDDYETYYTDALDSLQRLYDVWDKTNHGDTTYDFSDYQILIWYTGDHRQDIFSQADIESLMAFLDTGGKLFLTSQDAAEALSASGDPLDSIFLTDYLHCDLDTGSASDRQVMGVDGDGVGDGFYMYLSGTPSPQNQTSRDALIPDNSADTVLNYAGSAWSRTDLVAGLKYEGDYKLVFFGFGFEGMNTAAEFQGQPLASPQVVMERVLDWLEGYTDVSDSEQERASIPRSVELHQNYPNPFNPETRIRFTIKGRQSSLHTSLKIYNIRGQLVRTLLDGDRTAGDYDVLWDGRDDRGMEVSSGIYFYRLSAGSSSQVKKMVLLK